MIVVTWETALTAVAVAISLASLTVSIILWRRSGAHVVAMLRVSPRHRVREEQGRAIETIELAANNKGRLPTAVTEVWLEARLKPLDLIRLRRNVMRKLRRPFRRIASIVRSYRFHRPSFTRRQALIDSLRPTREDDPLGDDWVPTRRWRPTVDRQRCDPPRQLDADSPGQTLSFEFELSAAHGAELVIAAIFIDHEEPYRPPREPMVEIRGVVQLISGRQVRSSPLAVRGRWAPGVPPRRRQSKVLGHGSVFDVPPLQ